MEDHQSSSKEKSAPSHKPRNFRHRYRGNSYHRKEYTSATSRELRSEDTLDNISTPLVNGSDLPNTTQRHKTDSKSDSHYTRSSNSNRFQRTNGNRRGNFNSNNNLADSNMAVYDAAVTATAEVNNRNEDALPREYSRHSKGSHKNSRQYQPSQNNNYTDSFVPYNASGVEYTHQENGTNSRHGQIVGGRYVRRQHSNPIPRNQSHYESDVKPENSYSVPFKTKTSFQEDSVPFKNKTSFPERRQNRVNHNEQQKATYEKSGDYYNNYSRRKAMGTTSGESSFATSDVYHYSSRNQSDQKFRKPTRNLASDVMPIRENDATQRELLIQHLNKGDCECLVCCEQIRVKDQTWHCLSCFHVFHLRCVRKWARSPTALAEGGWRCPACQSVTEKVPYDYFCFCGKGKNPEINYHLTPHSCGEVCQRRGADCSHLCKELCHPGPCPPCAVVVQKSCACGKTFKSTSCSHNVEETCSSICDKPLNCGFHSCNRKCHTGPCNTCQEEVAQNCFCGKSKHSVPCTVETATVRDFSCGATCGKKLGCGNHSCEQVCHPGDCTPCRLAVETVKHCPCGKTSIEMLVAYGKTLFRKSCQDAIPLCGKVCEKVLSCGPKDNPHRCQSPCHEGPCGTCPLSTSLKCRCGACTKEFQCAELSPDFQFMCAKRCTKRRNCGRHKCLNVCCVEPVHRCEQLCNKKLSCGSHQCQEMCHGGNCPQCWNVSFDELRCHCGETVLYPPIHCGTKPPECTKPCIREHPCEHEVRHTCHSDDTCPPCTSLTVKWCYGHHKQCPTVMCFMDGVSCGTPCLQDLPCGLHKCRLTCHAGVCLKPQAKCTQPCTEPRPNCGHPCGTPCHQGDCPDTHCKTQVTLTCPCGHRSETTTCHESSKSSLLMSMLASKMQDIKDGQSINLNEVIGKKSKNNKLQCNEECALIERNKRLAVALQIQNPDLSTSPGPPSYSEFLKEEARKNPSFVENVYKKITDLVQLAKESKQKCRSFSFPSMNRDQRRVVHELAEFFGCETQSYDEEPKKNVVVTAYKNKCWLPFMSIMSVVLKDMGLRKGPAPIISQSKLPESSQKKKIDYFDYNE